MSTSAGACVARARLHARFGSPIPTKTISPSRSSRAATTVIISSAEYFISVAVVHPRADLSARGEPLGESGMLREIAGAILHAKHEVVEVLTKRLLVPRHILPRDVEIVVAIVVSLRIRRMRAPWLDHHGIHDYPGNQRSIRIRAHDTRLDQLLDDDDHVLRRERRLLLHAEQ